MTTRPGYIWSGTEWVSIGQEAVVAPVSYQASAPSTPSTGDIWIDSNDDVPGIDTSQFLRWRKTAVGGETSVSGTDDNGLTLAYTANYEQVYLNGVLLVRGQDYTATNGTSITGLTALAANDVVEVFGVVARVVGDVYTQAQADAKYSLQTTTGLVLVNTTTFSAVSSISINNCFSATYDNYLLQVELTASTSSDTAFRLRSAGTDHSGSNYNWQYIYASGTTVSAARTSSTTSARFMYSQPDKATAPVFLYSPFKAEVTTYTTFTGTRPATTTLEVLSYVGGLSTSSSYDGFTVFPASGTITGTIKVYGYK